MYETLLFVKDSHGQTLQVDVEDDWGPEDAPKTPVVVVATRQGVEGTECALSPSDARELIKALQTGLDKIDPPR